MLKKPQPNKKPDKDLRQLSILASVPAIIFAAPLVGFFLGKWADKKFDTEPMLMTIGGVLGIAAAGVETYKLVKKSSAIDEEKNDK